MTNIMCQEQSNFLSDISNHMLEITNMSEEEAHEFAFRVWQSREWLGRVLQENVARWILVSERLPDKFGRYLCRYRVEEDGTVSYCTDFGRFEPLHKEWFVGEVTHWMELPEPPDGEEDANTERIYQNTCKGCSEKQTGLACNNTSCAVYWIKKSKGLKQ